MATFDNHANFGYSTVAIAPSPAASGTTLTVNDGSVFPFQDSTDMFGSLVEQGLKIDLFFFDGRIQPSDLPLILRLSRPTSIYLFDDYALNQKGIDNVRVLTSVLPSTHLFIEPESRFQSTLAAIVPMSMFRSNPSSS